MRGSVTIVVGDVGRIGIVVLNMPNVDVDFGVGVVGAGVALDVEIHIVVMLQDLLGGSVRGWRAAAWLPEGW